MSERILPFFWVHGEDKKTLEREIDCIYNDNIRAFCVESRTHPDFCCEKWWQDMDIILNKAKSLGMKVWVLDDKHFPTGYANGKVTEHPELTAWHIAERIADVGGMKNGKLRINCLPEDTLIYAAAYEYQDGAPNYDAPVELTDNFENSFLYFDLTENKQYRILTVWKTRAGGREEDRIDLINAESVQLQIDEVYEPHFKHCKEFFGNTFAGFFSDEPGYFNDYINNVLRLNVNSYKISLGIEGMTYPISDEALRRLYAHPLQIQPEDLVALWVLRNERDSEVRCAYMDIITDLYAENFSGKIGKWCRDHGVKYIGHVIEEMDSHVRTGQSPGHYFKSQTGQDMAGIDIVLNQLDPFFKDNKHLASVSGAYADPVFFDHTLSALAFSEAQMDPDKKGNSMCEIFGAFGWGLDISKMKWMLDLMLVGGINNFVPHAFTPIFPDYDCPPHFHAQGNNPQEAGFGYLMKYAGEMCELFSDGTPVVNLGVLYHAEAEWSGREYTSVDPILKVLHENQYNAFIVPSTRFDFANQLQCLVVPYMEFMPQELKQRLKGLRCKVIYVEKDGYEVLLKQLEELKVRDIKTEKAEKNLRFYHYRKNDRDYFLFFNAGTEDICARVNIGLNGSFKINDYLSEYEYATETEEGWIELNLPAGNSVVCTQGEGKCKRDTELKEVITKEFKVSLCTPDEKEFSFYKEVNLPFDVNGREERPSFSGTARFERVVELSVKEKYLIKLNEIAGDAVVFVNGKNVGRRICKPYIYDISDYIREGKNTISVDISNTLCNKIADVFSCYSAIFPLGLDGIEIYKIK